MNLCLEKDMNLGQMIGFLTMTMLQLTSRPLCAFAYVTDITLHLSFSR